MPGNVDDFSREIIKRRDVKSRDTTRTIEALWARHPQYIPDGKACQ